MTEAETPPDRDAFCARFKAHMVAIAVARGGDAAETARYAEATAPTYFDDQAKDDPDVSPEGWADEDMSYWEE